MSWILWTCDTNSINKDSPSVITADVMDIVDMIQMINKDSPSVITADVMNIVEVIQISLQ